MITNNTIRASMKIRLSDELPEETVFEAGIRRAPDRGFQADGKADDSGVAKCSALHPGKTS